MYIYFVLLYTCCFSLLLMQKTYVRRIAVKMMIAITAPTVEYTIISLTVTSSLHGALTNGVAVYVYVVGIRVIVSPTEVGEIDEDSLHIITSYK